MPRLDGIRSAAQIRDQEPEARIVILSMHVNATLVQQALKMGARGYVLKPHATDELPQAIRAVYQGELFLSPDIPQSYLPHA